MDKQLNKYVATLKRTLEQKVEVEIVAESEDDANQKLRKLTNDLECRRTPDLRGVVTFAGLDFVDHELVADFDKNWDQEDENIEVENDAELIAENVDADGNEIEEEEDEDEDDNIQDGSGPTDEDKEV